MDAAGSANGQLQHPRSNKNNSILQGQGQLTTMTEGRSSNRKSDSRKQPTFADRSTIHGVLDMCSATNSWEKALWVSLITTAIAAASFQSYETFKSYIAQETGTRIIVADRAKPSSMAEYVRFVYCPKNWLSLSNVEEDGIDKVLLMYAVSCIPYTDQWSLMALYSTLDQADKMRVRRMEMWQEFEEDSNTVEESFDWSLPGIINFKNDTSTNLWKQLEKEMQIRNTPTLLSFLSNFSGSLLQKSTDDNDTDWSAYYSLQPFTFRMGRLCQNVVAVPSPISYMGKAHDMFSFYFRYNHIPNSPPAEFFVSPYLGVEVGGAFQESMYTDLFDSQQDLYYVDRVGHQGILVVNYRLQIQIWSYINFPDNPCKPSETNHRYLAGHYPLHCQHICYDETIRKAKLASCSLLVNYGNNRPCSSARFDMKTDTPSEEMLPNITSQIYYQDCLTTKGCFIYKDCEDWLVGLSTYEVPRPGQISIARTGRKKAPFKAETFNPSFHLVEITFKSGIKYANYLLVTDQTFIGGVGGIFGLFIGASLLSFVQIILYCIKHTIEMFQGWRKRKSKNKGKRTSGPKAKRSEDKQWRAATF